MERPIGHIIPNEEPPLPMADDENSSADESPSGNGECLGAKNSKHARQICRQKSLLSLRLFSWAFEAVLIGEKCFQRI